MATLNSMFAIGQYSSVKYLLVWLTPLGSITNMCESLSHRACLISGSSHDLGRHWVATSGALEHFATA